MSVDVSEHTIRIATITIADRVDASNAPEVRENIHKVLESGTSKLVIDLTNVPFFDSAALAVLVSALKRARQMDGDVKLVWPKDEAAQRIFRLTKFDRVFDMMETVAEAQKAFGG